MKYRLSLRVYLLLSHLALVLLMLCAILVLLAWRARLSSIPVTGDPAADPPAVQASQPVNPQNQLDMVLFFGIFAIGSLVLGEVISSHWIVPLNSASDLAEKVANGDFSQQIQPGGPREMVELAANLNRMAEVLRSQLKSRQLVLANVTHELARPIGALRLGIDSLQSGALKDPALTEDLLNEMSRTLMRMEALVDDLSLAARPLTQPIAVDRKCFSIEPFLYGLRSHFWPQAEGRGIDLQLFACQIEKLAFDFLADNADRPLLVEVTLSNQPALRQAHRANLLVDRRDAVGRKQAGVEWASSL